MVLKEFKLKIPASSANIGPGFDVLGIGLNLYLEIFVKIDPEACTDEDPYNCKITCEGEGAEKMLPNSAKNLITNTALYVLRCNGIHSFPKGTQIHVKNAIPLGRGLGSSGAAIVGGILLGNEIGDLHLSKNRMMDYSLLIERHPDNIAASMLGGFVGSYLNELSPTETERKNVPLEHILPQYGVTPKEEYETRQPPNDIGSYLKYKWNKKVRCIAVIPKFEVPTDEARDVLPSSYSKQDIVFNLQRLAILTTALTMDPPDNKLIFEAMKDKIHQPYRTSLIPGLAEVLKSVTPQTFPGVCGICLSGAGPTILCLATSSFDEIAENVISIFKKKNVECSWKLLDVADEGALVEY